MRKAERKGWMMKAWELEWRGGWRMMGWGDGEVVGKAREWMAESAGWRRTIDYKFDSSSQRYMQVDLNS